MGVSDAGGGECGVGEHSGADWDCEGVLRGVTEGGLPGRGGGDGWRMEMINVESRGVWVASRGERRKEYHGAISIHGWGMRSRLGHTAELFDDRHGRAVYFRG